MLTRSYQFEKLPILHEAIQVILGVLGIDLCQSNSQNDTP